MSNYTKATNFTSKDTLPSGDPAKIVKGTEFDVEFNAIATAIASKEDSSSFTAALALKASLASGPTFTGTVKGNSGTKGLGAITITAATAAPTGGNDGDIHMIY